MKTNLIILAGITLIATNTAFAGGQHQQNTPCYKQQSCQTNKNKQHRHNKPAKPQAVIVYQQRPVVKPARYHKPAPRRVTHQHRPQPQKKVVREIVKVVKIIKTIKTITKHQAHAKPQARGHYHKNHRKAERKAERKLKRANDRVIAAQRARLQAERNAAHARKLAAQRAQADRRLAAHQARVRQQQAHNRGYKGHGHKGQNRHQHQHRQY